MDQAPRSPDDSSDRDRLAGLFQFAEGLLRARDKTLMAMRSTGLGYFPESALGAVPGLELDAEDGSWLKLRRLRETRPPLPDESHVEWIDGRIDLPDRPPVPHRLIAKEVDLDEASDLCEGDIVDPSEIETLDEVTGRVRVVIRLERLDLLNDELDAWIDGLWERWAVDERQQRRSIGLYNQLYQLHNLMHGGAAVAPELVRGSGIARWRTSAGAAGAAARRRGCRADAVRDVAVGAPARCGGDTPFSRCAARASRARPRRARGGRTVTGADDLVELGGLRQATI